MKNELDLDAVVEQRRQAFSATPPAPRIGIPMAADSDDDVERRALVTQTLESTTDDLKKIGEALRVTHSHTYTWEKALGFSVLSIAGAILAVLLGIWLFNLGVNMDIGS
ncbi:hypothetical protein ACT3SZ_07975 [Corynebacterium sp. AOP40-9SA-29]|uniref:hypothetical protein n=1 Tax=Corynebacterium sp. AOP40-9SA-29 TaxID=3457677 RepID=UPI004033371C